MRPILAKAIVLGVIAFASPAIAAEQVDVAPPVHGFNRADAVRIIQHYLKITPSQAGKAYETAAGTLTDDGFVSERALALSVRRAREKASTAADPKLTNLVDWTPLREITADRRKLPVWLRQYDP